MSQWPSTKARRVLASLPRPRFTFAKHPNLRFWVIPRFPNDLIFYEDEPALVNVVRVLHGARDPERVLKRL